MTKEETQLMRDIWDALHEAAYEYCYKCHELNDDFIHSECGIKCPYQRNRCFVQSWCRILIKTAPMIAKKTKYEE